MTAQREAYSRFRPMLALEPSGAAPVVMRGILPAWERLARAAQDEPWYERVLPARFRPSFSVVPGLGTYAGGFARDVPERLRSQAWRRLIEICDRFGELTTAEKAGVAQLLGQLCLFPELERLMAATAAPSHSSLGDCAALLAYWKVFTPFMLYEPDWLDRTAVLLRVAEAAKAGTRVRLIAALKFLVLNLEHRRECVELPQARRFAERALTQLCSRVPAWEALVWQSKWWRTVCYFPFHGGEIDRLDRELGRACDLAEGAIEEAAGAGALAQGVAEENLHAVLATRAIACMHLQRPLEAERWFERMAELDPDGAWQRIGLGRARLAAGRVEQAKADFKRGMELAVLGRDDAFEGLSQCMALLGRATQARRWRLEAESVRRRVDAAQSLLRA